MSWGYLNTKIFHTIERFKNLNEVVIEFDTLEGIAFGEDIVDYFDFFLVAV